MGGEGAGRGAARWHVGDSPPRAPMGFAAPAQDAPLDRGLAPAPAPAPPGDVMMQRTHSRYKPLHVNMSRILNYKAIAAFANTNEQ